MVKEESFPLSVFPLSLSYELVLAAASDVDDSFSQIGSILSAKNEKENDKVAERGRKMRRLPRIALCATRMHPQRGAVSFFRSIFYTLYVHSECYNQRISIHFFHHCSSPLIIIPERENFPSLRSQILTKKVKRIRNEL